MKNILRFIEDPVSQRLFSAMMDLAAGSDLDSITIAMVLERSGVGRTTFYRKFRNKYDFLNQCYDMLVYHTMGKGSEDHSHTKGLTSLLKALREDAVFFRKAFSSREPDSLRYYIMGKSYSFFLRLLQQEKYDVASPVLKMKLQAYVSGLMEITISWLEMKNMKEEDLVRVYYELMPDELRFSICMRYL